ncbi:type I pantothenate kinase [Oscillochloris sp. ZM17-4]|uniref:type I pantothenate kinase n=1 Tax=Oscillochloris sp. ZM17-4 TaxID=2866714 RepID=UPI001C72EC3A|nr:type I pantothenate kinase [Oscillochloris sp. ZM17-4]MBX0327670.1 type I pantothenate kinase [Oscillochloris sp. ZM17-4]
MQTPTDERRLAPYTCFSRAEWARLRNGSRMPLSEGQLQTMVSLNDSVSLEDVADIYLPLVRLIQLYYESAQQLYQATSAFLGGTAQKVPYVIGIAGSVAVGKSSTARIVQALLASRSVAPRVDLVTTDGFLLPNQVLQERGIMHRKGFPESYDRRRLLQFIADIKSGLPQLAAPIYSHLVYDIVDDQVQMVDQPDILVVEGLNVLQRGGQPSRRPQLFVSDFFDFSIYVDADESLLQQWYVERFLKLRETAFRDPSSYFRRYSELSAEESVTVARRIWREINGVNLRQNIEPTRERADLILEKGPRHTLERVYLRKL